MEEWPVHRLFEIGERVEAACRVPEAINGDSCHFKSGEMEIGDGGIASVFDVAPPFEMALAASQKRGEVVVVVGVGVAEAGSVDGDGVVEKASFTVRGGAEFVEEIGELLHVERVDFGHLFDKVRVAAVVGAGVVRFGDAGFGIGAEAAFAREHEGDHAGGAGGEGESGEIKKQAGVFAVAGGNAGWRGSGGGGERGRLVHAGFDFANGGEVFLELAAVRRAEVASEAGGFCAGEVQDALAGGALGGAKARVAEKTIEDGAGVHLRGDGLGR